MQKLLTFLTILVLLGPGLAHAQFFGGSFDGYGQKGHTDTLIYNNPPVITESASNVTILEDAALTAVDTLHATDADGDALTWSIIDTAGVIHGVASAGAGSDSSIISYTPSPDSTGVDSFFVRVADNNGGADTLKVVITVTGVNDAPSFTASDPAATNEDGGAQTVSNWVTAFDPGPPDEDSQTVAAYTVAAVGTPGLFSAGPAVDINGNLTYTPAGDSSGTSTFDVTVKDNGGTVNSGVDTSASQQFTITVTGVNDAPSFSNLGNQTHIVGTNGAQIVSNWAHTFVYGPPNENGQVVSDFIISNIVDTDDILTDATPPDVSNSGELTYTLTGASGSAVVNIALRDNGGTAHGGVDSSAVYTLTIAVSANSQPVIGESSPQAVTVNEDATATTVVTLNATDGDGEDLAWSILTPATHGTATAAAGPGASSAIGYAPTADYHGSDSLVVQVSDGNVGGTDQLTVNVTVSPVNDAPSFTASDPAAVNEDGGAQTVSNWVTAFDPGPDNENTQAVAAYTVTAVGTPSLFSVVPAVDNTGQLTYTPAGDSSGTSTFDVTVQDNGGTNDGGDDTSVAQPFTITVTGVNDAPSFSNLGNQTHIVGTNGAQIVSNWAHTFVYGPPNENGQVVSDFIISNIVDTDDILTDATPPDVSNSGELTYTLTGNAGSATVDVALRDNGSTAHGGVDSSAVYTLTITVSPNSSPVITETSPHAATMSEDGSPTPFALTLHATDAENHPLTWSIFADADSGSATVVAGPADSSIISYTPNSNYNGNDTFVVQVSDGMDTDQLTVNVTVDPVNDAPTSADRAIEIAEDIDYIFTESDFHFADVDAGAALDHVQIVTIPTPGALYNDVNLDGVVDTLEALSNLDTVLVADIGAGQLKFKPVDSDGADGDGYIATFPFMVHDGTVYSDSSYTMTCTVIAVLDIPLLPPGETSGWGWISSYFFPSNPDISYIWSQIPGLNILQDIDGFYIPGLIDMIGIWDNSSMYMMNAGGGTLRIPGTQAIPATDPIALDQGWNWIAYYRDTEMAADSALASIEDYLLYADDHGTGLYLPDQGVNTLIMRPFQGYRVYVNAPCTLIYPNNDPPTAREDHPELPVIAETEHFDFHESNYYYPVLFVDDSIQELALEIGDEVALFAQRDGEPFCIGASVWQGEVPFTISGWTDDPMTDEKDGYTAGEPIIVRSWTAIDDQESDVPVMFEDDNSTYESGIYSVASVDTEALGTGDEAESYEFKLEQNRPNPFNPSTTIQYEIPRASQVTLRIYNVSGQLIRTLVDKDQPAGSYQIVWDARNNNGSEVASGVYFYNLETTVGSAHKRMVLLR